MSYAGYLLLVALCHAQSPFDFVQVLPSVGNLTSPTMVGDGYDVYAAYVVQADGTSYVDFRHRSTANQMWDDPAMRVNDTGLYSPSLATFNGLMYLSYFSATTASTYFLISSMGVNWTLPSLLVANVSQAGSVLSAGNFLYSASISGMQAIFQQLNEAGVAQKWMQAATQATVFAAGSSVYLVWVNSTAVSFLFSPDDGTTWTSGGFNVMQASNPVVGNTGTQTLISWQASSQSWLAMDNGDGIFSTPVASESGTPISAVAGLADQFDLAFLSENSVLFQTISDPTNLSSLSGVVTVQQWNQPFVGVPVLTSGPLAILVGDGSSLFFAMSSAARCAAAAADDSNPLVLLSGAPEGVEVLGFIAGLGALTLLAYGAKKCGSEE